MNPILDGWEKDGPKKGKRGKSASTSEWLVDGGNKKFFAGIDMAAQPDKPKFNPDTFRQGNVMTRQQWEAHLKTLNENFS